MKTNILIFTGLFILLGLPGNLKAGAVSNDVKKESVTLFCPDNLLPLSEKLVREYLKTNPGFGMEVKATGQTEPSEFLKNESSSGIIADETFTNTVNNLGWKIVIGREIVVPVINAENPYLETLKKQGLSAEKILELIAGELDWGTVMNQPQSSPALAFITDEMTVRSSATSFLGNPDESKMQLKTTGEFILSIQKNPFSIGFCRLSDILDQNQRNLASGIQFLPIDKNRNGSLDYHEQIYGSVENLMRGIWIGKYPDQLVQNICFASSSQPQNQSISDFLGWVLTDGQPTMAMSGFNELVASERRTKLDKINPETLIAEVEENKAGQNAFIYIVCLLVIAATGLMLWAGYRKSRVRRIFAGNAGQERVINENTLEIPNGLYFDKTHTWIYLEKDGIAKIGIDDFLQHIAGNFTRVKMKEPGVKIKKGEPILTLIQSGKQISLNAPISGTIKEINELLVTDPGIINQSPYSQGWVYMIEPSNWLREIQFFKMAATYRDWIKAEFIRLKDLLATFSNIGTTAPSMVALQEGGELKDHVLHDLSPELWEEFQRNFIDNPGI